MSSSLLRALPPPARVLIAEDTSIHSQLEQFLLEAEGYDVDVVPDGRAAVRAFRRCRYALVLVDCRMPMMDGFAAVKAMRRFEREHQLVGTTPIVAITVALDEASRTRCMRSGMTACLQKPLNLEALGRVLSEGTRPLHAAT